MELLQSYNGLPLFPINLHPILQTCRMACHAESSEVMADHLTASAQP